MSDDAAKTSWSAGGQLSKPEPSLDELKEIGREAGEALDLGAFQSAASSLDPSYAPNAVHMTVDPDEAPPAVYTPGDPERRSTPDKNFGDLSEKDAASASENAPVEADVPGLSDDATTAVRDGDAPTAAGPNQPQSVTELEEFARRMAEEHPIGKALRGHLKPAPSRESYEVDQAEGERTIAPGSPVEPFQLDEAALKEAQDRVREYNRLERERASSGASPVEPFVPGLDTSEGERYPVSDQKGAEIPPETPDDMRTDAELAAEQRVADITARIAEALRSLSLRARIALIGVPVVAILAAAIVTAGGARQAAATPAPAAATPALLVNLQPAPQQTFPTSTLRPGTTHSPVGAQRLVFVYVRLSGSSRSGCPAPGTVLHEDLQEITVFNPVPGAALDFPLVPWTHPRCGSSSFGLADFATPIGPGANPALPGFASPLFYPDTTYEFLNDEPHCTGNTCTRTMTLRVINRATR